MLPLRVTQNISRIDDLIKTMDQTVSDVEPRIQNVFANHIVLAGAGFVEDSILATLSEYGNRHGDPKIARFIEKSVARNNSLNCEKIQQILNHFDKDWWPTIRGRTDIKNLSAIDSLKTLRDQIAHGKPNGTGYITVKDYYSNTKRFVFDVAAVINP